MSVNELMHPRNRYRKKPNLQELIKDFPELNQVALVDVSGKVKLDYKNAQSLQLLSKCLLLRDFGLHLELPVGKLVPTLPLRLNYIHWLEDIGAAVGWHEKGTVRGVDIGCGASCIYPLLAVVQSNRRWQMVAIEKAADSLQIARANVRRNNLEPFIDVRPQAAGGESILLDVLETFERNERFDFCMCNPPFYDSASGVQPANRTGKRREPSNASTGSIEELCTEGGEVAFISQIINESIQLNDRIAVYTTMIGHKKSYDEILKKFKQTSINNITVCRFFQGNTTRWALAWSFDNRIHLNSLSSHMANEKSTVRGKKKPLKKPIEWKIWSPQEGCQMVSLDQIKMCLLKILESIALKVRLLSEKNDETLYELIAHQNTWSHQRRKRRGRESVKAEKIYEQIHHNKMHEACDENGNPEEKRRKLEETVDRDDSEQPPYLRMAMKVTTKNNDYFLAVQYIDGIAGKDSANQILQFIQNSIRIKSIHDMCPEENEVRCD